MEQQKLNIVDNDIIVSNDNYVYFNNVGRIGLWDKQNNKFIADLLIGEDKSFEAIDLKSLKVGILKIVNTD
jgi:hypothetical protein